VQLVPRRRAHAPAVQRVALHTWSQHGMAPPRGQSTRVKTATPGRRSAQCHTATAAWTRSQRHEHSEPVKRRRCVCLRVHSFPSPLCSLHCGLCSLTLCYQLPHTTHAAPLQPQRRGGHAAAVPATPPWQTPAGNTGSDDRRRPATSFYAAAPSAPQAARVGAPQPGTRVQYTGSVATVTFYKAVRARPLRRRSCGVVWQQLLSAPDSLSFWARAHCVLIQRSAPAQLVSVRSLCVH
jgi:hypothetical protein